MNDAARQADSAASQTGLTPIERVLDYARWAPSGDNTQPWRFEVQDAQRAVVHGHDTREHCVYDLDGHGSHLALGALLETIAIAATTEGCRADVAHRSGSPDAAPLFDVTLVPRPGLAPDPLVPAIRTRAVQRRPMRTRRLEAAEKQALEAAVQPGYRVMWLETPAQKWAAARLLFANAGLRLTMREAYEVHRRIIAWNACFSTDRIPDRSLGLDPLTLKLMRWVMGSWARVRFFNAYLAGTLAPRIQLDLVPALACGAHFVLVADRPATTLVDYVEAGRRLQRFWLTAERLGLKLQPEVTPLIFARYLREGRRFTAQADILAAAAPMAERLRGLLAGNLENAVFMGRIGAGRDAACRSLRRPLAELQAR
ncbi:MAG: molybdopterin biosynthesis protein MoeY [Pseudomonadota bacterium]